MRINTKRNSSLFLSVNDKHGSYVPPSQEPPDNWQTWLTQAALRTEIDQIWTGVHRGEGLRSNQIGRNDLPISKGQTWNTNQSICHETFLKTARYTIFIIQIIFLSWIFILNLSSICGRREWQSLSRWIYIHGSVYTNTLKMGWYVFKMAILCTNERIHSGVR